MREYKLYGLFVGLTVTIMITCDTLVYRVFDVFGYNITASGIIFSLCFLISTIMTEVYGYRLSVINIWIVVFCQSVFVMLVYLSSIIQPDFNGISTGYNFLFRDFWRVMIGSWISVPVSYFINGFIISKLKIVFYGKFFLIRYTIGSMTTQAALLLTAYPISLSGKYSLQELTSIILTTWSYKVCISLLLLPIAIWLVNVVKRIEKTDHYDWGVSYNPTFIFKRKK